VSPCCTGSAGLRMSRFELTLIGGLARARAEGTRLGRPIIPAATEDAIRAALSQPGRPGVRKIPERFKVSPSTVQRISADMPRI
jgi:hypothetical protein